MKTKITKDSRNLLIAMLIGDGTISNNNVFKLSHSNSQRDYLEWKINQLNNLGIKNNGVKEYISSTGYNKGKTVVYTQLKTTSFIKLLRRIIYKGKKNTANTKLLNRLDARGIAIWYMDDGHINIRRSKGKVHGFYIKISTCVSKVEAQIYIDYFKSKWGISFYTFSEGKGTYSLCCGTNEGLKFIHLVMPYVLQIPSMHYKIDFKIGDRLKSIRSPKKDEAQNTCKM